MATLTKEQKMADRDELRDILSTHETVYGIVKHVSRSGMQRRIEFFVIESDAHGPLMRRISHLVASVRGERLTDDGVVVNGAGMDMGWHEIYSCRYTLGLGEWRGEEPGEEHFHAGYGFDLRYL